jgi:hypothetical protein
LAPAGLALRARVNFSPSSPSPCIRVWRLKISIDKRAPAGLLAACFRVPPLLFRLSASPGSGAKLRRKQNFIADR